MHGISVVLPCYQSGRLLGEAVESITRQPFKCRWEIIVVDDCSPDSETQKQLEALARIEPVSVIRLEEHAGPQRARNTGVRNSQFDFILMMDSDDRLSLDERTLRKGTYADRAIAVLAANPDVAFMHSTTWMIGGASGPTDSAYPLSEQLIAEKHHASTWIIFRKSDALRAGLYDESIQKWQDWSFAVALLSSRREAGAMNKIGFLPEPYYLYRLHEEGARISFSNADEYEMVKRTLTRHPQIFRHYFPNLELDEIARRVLSTKPGFLKTFSCIAKGNPRALPSWLRRRLLERASGARHLGT
ncbi:MAG: glycosyltransferase family 2 protein [Gemmatimonadaceae bacterium]